MSVINSANVQVGQSSTATNNITLNTDVSGNLIINKGVYPTLTALLTLPNGGLVNYANDAAAAAGGVAVGSLYRNGSIVQVRVA